MEQRDDSVVILGQQEVVPLCLMELPLAEVDDQEGDPQVEVELDVAFVVGLDEVGAHGRVNKAAQVGH